MKTITKHYSGEQDGYLYPREQSIGGVSGDSDACKIYFKLPNQYLSSEWSKMIVFDKELYDPVTKEYHVFEYQLSSDNSFTIPVEITDQCRGKTISYHLVLSKGTDVIQSHSASLFFSRSARNVNITTYLSTHAFVDADFTIDTSATVDRPVLRLYRMEGNPEVDVVLEMPYLLNGKIPSRFISGGSGESVKVKDINSPTELISWTDAKLGDWGRGIGTIEGKNYVLLKEPYSVQANWELITDPTPVFTEIQTEDLKVTNSLELGGIADVETAINGKLEKFGEAAPGQPYRLPYFFEISKSADSIKVTDYTITMDGNNTKETFDLDVPAMDGTNAGLYTKTLADKKQDTIGVVDAEIPITGWTDEGSFKVIEITATGLKESHYPIIGAVFDGATPTEIEEQMEAANHILKAEPMDGKIKFFADAVPAVKFPIVIRVM